MKLTNEERQAIMTEAVKEVDDYMTEDEMFARKCLDIHFYEGAIQMIFSLKLKELEEGRN